MVDNIYSMVTDKSDDFRGLWNRMDTDRDLYFMKAYEMLRPDNKKKMEDVINVNFNDATTFGMRAIATLGGAQKQAVVEGRQIDEKKAAFVENFIDDFTYIFNERLPRRGILDLDAFLNEQICIRGHIVVRVALHKKDGKLIPDVLPLDSRFFVYDMDVDGMKWGAYITKRSKRLVANQYGVEIKSTEAEVMDFWDKEWNVILVGGAEVKRQPNPYGYPPFIKTESASGSMLADEEALEHRGESIYWANRGLFPELNRTASIFQTLNVGSFAGAVQYESTAGTTAQKPQRPPWGIYSVSPVEKGMGYKPFPVNDIRQAARLFYAILYTRIQQGGLSAIDYGNLTFPLSAVAITRLTSSRDQIFLPRIQAKAILYQQLYKMIIDQYNLVGIKAAIGREGFLNEYNPKDLLGDYAIKFRFFTESKEQEIANYSVANAAQAFVSDATIRRDILRLQDPDGEEEKIALEQAEKMDEALFLYRRCSKLIAQEGKDIEARILADRLMTVLKARKAMTQAPIEEGKVPQKKAGGRQIIPLLGQGNAGGTLSPEVGQEETAIRKEEIHEERIAEEGSQSKAERVNK